MPADTAALTIPEKKALVASFFDRVWCQKDLDYHHQVLSPDFQLTALWQNTSLGGSGQADREVSLAVIDRWIHGFPDLRISIEEQVSDGEYVASRHRFWGTHTGDFMGFTATHIPVVISGNTVMRISGDQIVGAWSCWDAASFLTQIGVPPGTPDTPRLGDADLGAWHADDRHADGDPMAAMAVVRRVFEELWNNATPHVADHLLAAGFVGHTPGNHAIGGPDGMTRVVEWWRSILSGLRFEVDAQFAEGGAVATRFTATGTHTGTLAGRPPTGAPVTFTGISVTHIADDLVVSDWTEFDTAGVVRAIDDGSKRQP